MVVGIYVVVRHSRMAQSMFSVYSSGAQYFGSDLFVFFFKDPPAYGPGILERFELSIFCHHSYNNSLTISCGNKKANQS